ncbi:efflux RND transporter periplasmic adaptor subunit [Betaproteobacteria bacterium PRO7]|jgi:RND family efflux transporter MFP subunit|nr:efflux RND transporter periplasmic adaptor subunit [Betaproteobacteria bacterium PRO7]
MTKRRKFWIGAIAAILVVGGIGAAVGVRGAAERGKEKKKETPPLEFTQRDVVRLAPHSLAQELVLPGNVLAVSQATVRSKLSAEVRRVHVREGDRVAAGHIVAEFDTAALRTQFAERTAALESARAQLEQTERTRQANAQLVQQNFISKNAFDTADSAYRAQAAAVEAARAQLEQTQLMLNDAVVRTPIAGQVAKRYVQPGEKVSFDAPLFAIVDLAQLEVQAQAPVADVARIARGAKAEVEVEGLSGRAFAGRVDRINPSAEPGTRTINVYVALANEDSVLRAGMFARVRLHVGADKEVPALPLSAVRIDNGQPIVWVIADGKLVRRQVRLGRRDERAQLVEIVEGVTPADQVIATKFDNLRDGLAAKIISGTPAGSKVADKDAPRAPALNAN